MAGKKQPKKAFVGRDGLLKIELEDGTIATQKKKADMRTLYCEDMKKKIVSLGLQGMTPYKIAQELDLSNDTIYSWFIKYGDLVDAYENARAMSAYKFEEMLLELAETTADSADVNVNRFKSEIYFKLAQIRAPKVYGQKKQAVDAEVTPNVVINFVTGVPRAGEKHFISKPAGDAIEVKSDEADDSPPDDAA